MTIKSLLIANRGEIACRVIRTARRLGVRTVAVYSDADRHALHVREADEAVHIGGSPARESYLVGEKIVAAAKAAGAEAIHPGYGFLSENADFAEAVEAAGLVWVGPRASSIRAMGLKDAAKKLMMAAGVPVTPGYLGEDQDPARLRAEADSIGYPVLIKAVAGGGGKGMRRVNHAAEFQDMLASCKREAAASFGDDRVLIEKYIERPRHIEVQVFGDSHGNVVHLFERDCSLQRRHQKVIEEAPAPGMDEATRAAVCGAAVKAARAVDYVGAGTVEFIADASAGLRPDRVWFMEMNTRLQVEHPVTEEITGQDLVEWQLRIAGGEALPLRQEELSIRGWAMEARLYAEDPAHEFLPSTGRLDHFELGRAVRVDTGVEEGDRISPYYDPMIAKLIARGATREEAIDRLVDTLEQVEVWPVRTNAGFLARAADDADFRAGDVDTAFIPSRIDRLVPDPAPPEGVWNLAAAALLASDFGAGQESPWDALQGFRLNGPADRGVAISHGGATRVVEAGGDPPLEGIATAQGESVLAFSRGQAFAFTLPGSGGGASGGAAADGTLLSPMPGRVIAVEVRQGDKVAKGQKLVTLEAMKMEHSLAAPFDGIVAELAAEAGAQVQEGMLLVRVEKGE
ncbi:MAG: acetyl/propionyl/methylcrotonyl-CoA carboxylase subunit alpha [Alphaproteobacteria bacterium]|nr:acetyl/propionyl/methylcrotonyl-CoA carboxylase subunit alpha [Alphaproteobacteria bacterium]MBV9370592.1 acetyl/propionyl/methylcrotonyl-CoA carboxylase subunit alpha [Alphaproteobacteria bacterium]MBV9902564.1 acetyl/propionyl/methylcrotonyl-CoA carboxylase subunit alpha [Alphaproteobacteria bacterium]